MDTHVYKIVQITGTSTKGSDDAVRVAIEKAGQSVRNLRWFRITDTRGEIENGKVAYWQVSIELGFTLE
ncbi:MAG: dodecin domain-containing protein [Sinobacteraceae bacterium]|nr:dodecin domain-containing protein [Nevskiaceae bacterium]